VANPDKRVRSISDGIQENSVAVKKTALGIQVMKDRSVSLTPQQRSALILVDSKRDAADIVRMTAAVGVTLKDIEALIAMELVESDTDIAGSVAPASPPDRASEYPEVALSMPLDTDNPTGIDFQIALNAAITLCSDLGFKGFSLNMALTGVDSLEKLQKMMPDIRKAAGDKKYALLHPYIFGKPL
jgi:hypothetical protein